MRTFAKVVLAVVVSIVFTVSVSLAGDPPFSGFLGGPDVYKQLMPGPEGGVKLRWTKPGTNFSKYNKFMVDSVVFYFADDSEYKGIDPELMKELSDSFNKELVAAFENKYKIVSEPGPDVVRLRLAITNVKQSRPVLSAVSSIMPVGLVVSIVKKGATGGWTGGGETCAELMALDSTTNEVIAMGVDQQQAGFTERFSKYGSANEAFKFWAGRIVKFMDTERGNPDYKIVR